jgi:hypothetical protein
MKLMKTPDACEETRGTLKELESFEEVTRSIKLLLWENALLRDRLDRLENIVGELDVHAREAERRRAFKDGVSSIDPDAKDESRYKFFQSELDAIEFNHTRLLEHHKGEDADNPGEGRKRVIREFIKSIDTSDILVPDWRGD